MDTDSSEEDVDGPPALPIRIPLGHRPVIFSLPGNHELVTKASAYLGWDVGCCSFGTFANGEITAKVEETVTNRDVFLFGVRDDLQAEMNFSIMRLLMLIAALRGESPYRLTVVLPCLDYARQDRKLVSGEATPPKLLLRCMKTAGADRFLTADLHNLAEAGFAPAGMAFDDLSCVRYLADFVRANITGFDPDKTLVCATNGGGILETRHMAQELQTGFIIVEGRKGRLEMISSRNDHAEAIVVVDDIFDTCATLGEVCRTLHACAPSSKVYAIAPHGYFSGNAQLLAKELVDTCNLEWMAVTNSISQAGALQRFRDAGLEGRLKVVDISKLFAGAVARIHLGASVNVPKFRNLGPEDRDPLLQVSQSRELKLARQPSSPPLKAFNPPQYPLSPLARK